MSRAKGTVSSEVTSETHYALPKKLIPNSNVGMVTQFTYGEFFQPKLVTGPNGDTAGTFYDPAGRVIATGNAHGGGTGVSYPTPNTKVETGNGRFTRTTMDGFGRPIKVETGIAAGLVVKSIVETEYDTCACTPLGKMKRVSQPYAPGGTVYWTVYTYDGMGRTVSIAHPGGSGTTSYVYEGNATKVTDPAGKWKRSVVDAFGNLVKVTEPDPVLGNVDATYAYDVSGQMLTATMARGGPPQVRTWVYDGLKRLQSETLPETGTTTYTYCTDAAQCTVGLLWHKIDAKGQKVEYIYDSMKRVTMVKKYTPVSGAFVEQICERVEMVYGTDVTGGSSPNYTVGRVTEVRSGNKNMTLCPGPGALQEQFVYTQGGLVASKELKVTQEVYQVGDRSATLKLGRTYNGFAQALTMSYPSYYTTTGGAQEAVLGPGPQITMGYDTMGRLQSVREGASFYHINSITYGAAEQLTGAVYPGGLTQVREYNARLQLTRIATSGGWELLYDYPATANNGQIEKYTQKLGATTVQAVQYEYDSLKRLKKAYTLAGSSLTWGLQYTYDGFGNLNAQTPTAGTPPSWNYSASTANNRIIGFGYDSNGNMTSTPGPLISTYEYDVTNRLKKVTMPGAVVEEYGYGAGGERLWRKNTGVAGGYEIYFYKDGGERLGKYYVSGIPSSNIGFYLVAHDPVLPKGLQAERDRLGSRLLSTTTVYLPYGEEYTPGGGSVPPNGQDKFGTYQRDANTGLDYAVNRYYSSQTGRFLTADPYKASGGPGDPGSWNRYSYVGGDPANANDWAGLYECWVENGLSKCGEQAPSSYYEPHTEYVYGSTRDWYSAVAAMGHARSSVGYGVGQDPWPGRTDIDPARRANALRVEIQNGNLNDCEALVAFATQTTMSFNQQGTVSMSSYFVQEFGVFVPRNHPSVSAARTLGVDIAASATTNPFQPVGASGFKGEFQDIAGGDQVHHFAAFFQFGFFAGSAAGASAGILSDILNPGDQNLAIAAASMGARLRSGELSMQNIPGEISRLCR